MDNSNKTIITFDHKQDVILNKNKKQENEMQSMKSSQDTSIEIQQNAQNLGNFYQDESLSQFKLVLKTLSISVPNVLSFGSLWILNFSNLKIAEIFKNENYLNAYAMSFMWANALGFALILCLNNGLCAMSSQAIGFNQFKLVSSYYQRSQVLNFLFLGVFAILMLHTDKIFSYFTTPTVCELSQQFMNGYIPSLFFYVIFDSTRNIFNAYKKFQIPNFMIMITYTIHGVWVYLLMKVLDMKMEGLGISRSITECLNAIILLIVVKYKGYFKDLQFKWTKQAFKNWGSYLKLSIPMGSILYLDWLSSDIQTLFIASIGDKNQFAGHSSFVSIFLLYVVCPLGLSITVMTYLGQAIGKGSVRECQKITKTAFFSSLVVSITTTIIAFIFEDFFANMFTNTPGEYKYFKYCYRIFNYITIHGLALSQSMGSIMRASGKQNSAFIVPLVFSFLLGMPLQYLFVFTFQWGLLGSWFSFSISVYCIGLTFLYQVYNINWNKQIKIVQDMITNQKSLVFSESQEGIEELNE